MPQLSIERSFVQGDQNWAPARGPATELEALDDRTREYIAASTAPATRLAYKSDWKLFSSWCHDRGLQALPASPRTVADYLSDHAGRLKPSTLGRRLTTISQAHLTIGAESPVTHSVVRRTWRGIRREHGTAPRKVRAVEQDDLGDMLTGLSDDRLIDRRDRAMLAIGWTGALRRSEVVALDVEDLTFTSEGLEVRIGRSKADQEGQGVTLGLPYSPDPTVCPVRALQAWLQVSGITSGPVFVRVDRHGRILPDRLSGRAYAERVKTHGARIGMDPRDLGGHSPRRGFISTAIRRGVQERIVMAHSRHRSLSVFRGYISDAGTWQENAAVAVMGGGR